MVVYRTVLSVQTGDKISLDEAHLAMNFSLMSDFRSFSVKSFMTFHNNNINLSLVINFI